MTEYYNCPVANWYSVTVQEVSIAAVDEKCLTDWIQASQCRNDILLLNFLGYSLSFVHCTKLSTLIIQLKRISSTQIYNKVNHAFSLVMKPSFNSYTPSGFTLEQVPSRSLCGTGPVGVALWGRARGGPLLLMLTACNDASSYL